MLCQFFDDHYLLQSDRSTCTDAPFVTSNVPLPPDSIWLDDYPVFDPFSRTISYDAKSIGSESSRPCIPPEAIRHIMCFDTASSSWVPDATDTSVPPSVFLVGGLDVVPVPDMFVAFQPAQWFAQRNKFGWLYGILGSTFQTQSAVQSGGRRAYTGYFLSLLSHALFLLLHPHAPTHMYIYIQTY
jgi:hypothetical protein